ncbi:9387_t:CDS:2, partial [Racocetra persica]
HDRSLNYNVMDVHHVEVGRKKRERLKHSGKIKMEQTSIRLSSSLNLISMRYMRSKRLVLKRLNEDDEVIGYVPGVEIYVDGV